MEDDRRAHHNELERRRRDHIKDHFMNLKDAIPVLDGEKVGFLNWYEKLIHKKTFKNHNDLVGEISAM